MPPAIPLCFCATPTDEILQQKYNATAQSFFQCHNGNFVNLPLPEGDIGVLHWLPMEMWLVVVVGVLVVVVAVAAMERNDGAG